MKTIHKYHITSAFKMVLMPLGAKILCVQSQNDKPTIWASVDDKEPLEERRFEVIGTGHEIPLDSIYLGSAMGGPFMWHVYEIIPGFDANRKMVHELQKKSDDLIAKSFDKRIETLGGVDGKETIS